MLIWILLYTSVFSTVGSDDKFIMIYGETQTGKSSVVNAIFDKFVAEVGDASGNSITSEPTLYAKSFTKDESSGIPYDFTLNVLDTPGSLDTRLRITNADILDNIVAALSRVNIQQIDVIFIAESIYGTSTQLNRNLEEIRKIFGSYVMNSIVVLGTRVLEGKSKRNDEVRKLCDHHKLKFITYESTQKYDYNNQLKTFMNVIFDSGIKPYAMEKVKQVQKKIEERAQELMTNTPKEKEIIHVETERIEWKDVQKPESYIDQEWGEIGRGGRRYGLFGPRKRIDGWKPVRKTRTITVKEPYTVKVMEPQEREKDHDAEKFRNIARKEYLEKLKLPLQIKTEL